MLLSNYRDQVMEILCDEEGSRVSTGLSRYFGDSVETISEALVNENTARSAAHPQPPFPGGDTLRQGGERLLLSDLLTPAQVRQRDFTGGEEEGGGEGGGGAWACSNIPPSMTPWLSGAPTLPVSEFPLAVRRSRRFWRSTFLSQQVGQRKHDTC